jgi:hypothetical protein
LFRVLHYELPDSPFRVTLSPCDKAGRWRQNGRAFSAVVLNRLVHSSATRHMPTLIKILGKHRVLYGPIKEINTVSTAFMVRVFSKWYYVGNTLRSSLVNSRLSVIIKWVHK